ncbi:hypothetical protein QBC38DRAFT_200946 [Podospora fimiseda]|uniref:Uncharacterized protein n=1 Tax=Podospora fimiseda TaxID=252190 RepID=A0AAN7BZ77_9PEZI|nr:hypothetical protein QBC38DRAFT_200946 [Podospora fimiseda]
MRHLSLTVYRPLLCIDVSTSPDLPGLLSLFPRTPNAPSFSSAKSQVGGPTPENTLKTVAMHSTAIEWNSLNQRHQTCAEVFPYLAFPKLHLNHERRWFNAVRFPIQLLSITKNTSQELRTSTRDLMAVVASSWRTGQEDQSKRHNCFLVEEKRTIMRTRFLRTTKKGHSQHGDLDMAGPGSTSPILQSRDPVHPCNIDCLITP